MSEIEYTPEQAWRVFAACARGESVTPEQLAAAAAAAPRAALMFAADRLTDEQFAAAAAAAPRAALEYAADRLTAEQFAAAADLYAALEYAADGLTDEQFAAAVAAAKPGAGNAPERLAALQSPEKQGFVAMRGVRRRDGKDNGIDPTDGL